MTYQLELWQHTPTGDRYIVLANDYQVAHAAGPLTDAELRAAQADEWLIPWHWGLEAQVEQHRQEYVRVHPQGE